ncbi:MAG: hypothetical protein U5O39_10295 [Gammaproteobacteria bacterium]|nr:hypothetical protein [Gammaproteobacteria bacterium]
MPIMLSVVLVAGSAPDPLTILQIALAMLATYGVYELGYMDNDTRTVGLEVAPTQRVSDDEKRWFFAHRWFLIGLRGIIVGAAVLAIAWVSSGSALLIFCTGLVAMGAAFIAYNSSRGVVNVPLHLILVTARFCLPGTLLFPEAGYMLTMFIAFPLINSLERAGEDRYRLTLLASVARHRVRITA